MARATEKYITKYLSINEDFDYAGGERVDLLLSKKEAYNWALKDGYMAMCWKCNDMWLTNEDVTVFILLKNGEVLYYSPEDGETYKPLQSDIDAIIINDPHGYSVYNLDKINLIIEHDTIGDYLQMGFKGDPIYDNEEIIEFQDIDRLNNEFEENRLG